MYRKLCHIGLARLQPNGFFVIFTTQLSLRVKPDSIEHFIAVVIVEWIDNNAGAWRLRSERKYKGDGEERKEKEKRSKKRMGAALVYDVVSSFG